MEEGMEGGSLPSKSDKRFPKEGHCQIREGETSNISHTHGNPEWGVSCDVQFQGGVADREMDGEWAAEVKGGARLLQRAMN